MPDIQGAPEGPQPQHAQRTVAFVAIGTVLAVIAVLVVVKLASGSKSTPAAAPPVTTSTAGAGASSGTGTSGTPSAQTSTTSNADLAQVVTQATTVPAGTLDTVGVGSLAASPVAVTGQPALADGGKPQIVYMGFEWCPFCAAERWPLVVALSRFGTFSGLALTQSSGDDVYPNTNTFTFAKAAYTSQYISFAPVEMQDANHNPLQTPTAAQQTLLSTLDAAPYTSSPGSVPFVDIANRYVVSGASYSPQVLAGKSWTQIASVLGTPSDPIAQGVDGAANVLTAAICAATADQPSQVCGAPGVVAAKGKLG